MAEHEPVAEADQLRRPETAALPDVRNSFLCSPKPDGSLGAITLDERYEAIKAFVLNDAVPHKVRVHFETAKNLYLYAWFVYRFFPVAEKHVLATLEFALGERLAEVLPARYGPRVAWVPGLSRKLKDALESGLISNEGMRAYHRHAERRARVRVDNEATRQMVESGAEFVEYDPDSVVPVEADYAWDALQTYVETLPPIRNSYAHGSATLKATVLGTFEIVTDLVNQLFPPPASDAQRF